MCHGNKIRSGKTIRFNPKKREEREVTPYKKPKHKFDIRSYESYED